MTVGSKTSRATRIKNRVTGKREELVLLDFQQPEIEDALLADTSFSPELYADLTSALLPFSAIEKRILIRVLLQGQSIKYATARTNKSKSYWEKWFAKTLPALRSFLEDYREELSHSGKELIKSSIISSEESYDVVPPSKCKFCRHVAPSLNTLRAHVRKSHLTEYKQVHQYVAEKDYELARDATLLIELPAPSDTEDC